MMSSDDDDEDDLQFLSSVLNDHRKFDDTSRKSDDRFFARIRDDAKLGHSVERLKKRVELMDAKKDELEAVIKELKYINGHLSKELDEMKEKEIKHEETVENMATIINSSRDIFNSFNSPIQEFRAFIDFSFSSISLPPQSTHVPPTLAKLRFIYLNFDKLFGEASLLFENKKLNEYKPNKSKEQPTSITNATNNNNNNNNNNSNNNNNTTSNNNTNSKKNASTKQRQKSVSSLKTKEQNNNKVRPKTTLQDKNNNTNNNTNNGHHSFPPPFPSSSSEAHVISILEQENMRLRKEIEDIKEKEEFLSASIPHYRMAILKFKAHVKSLQDQIDFVSDEKRKIGQELHLLQTGVEESESEKLSAQKQLTLVQNELENVKENLRGLQEKYVINQIVIDQLQQTNHSLRVALENQIHKYATLSEREKEREREKEKEKEREREYKETEWQNARRESPDYNFRNAGIGYPPLPFQDQPATGFGRANLPPHFIPSSSSSVKHSFSPSLSPLSPYLSSSFSPPPTIHLRKELDNLDVEIEHLQASLKRQLLELDSPH